jgi:hypothetical protein
MVVARPRMPKSSGTRILARMSCPMNPDARPQMVCIMIQKIPEVAAKPKEIG